MTVMWDVQERSCAVCGRIFIPQAPKAKYCSEECRRKHEQDRAREARRKGAKPKRDRAPTATWPGLVRCTTRSWPFGARSR